MGAIPSAGFITPEFEVSSSSNYPQKKSRSHHDRATIAPRSGSDRGLIVIVIHLERLLKIMELIPR